MVQWLRLHSSTAGGTGLIPSLLIGGTKIPHALQCGQKKNQKQVMYMGFAQCDIGLNPNLVEKLVFLRE